MKYSLVLLLIYAACSQSKTPTQTAHAAVGSEGLEPQTEGIPYDLSTYDEVYPLDRELIEISGLSEFEDASLVGVNDEKGHFYVLDRSDMSIQKEYDFGKKGDYEGVERVGNIVYTIKSNGNIYPYDLTEQRDKETIKGPLNSSNDIEGISHDEKSNKLLIVCKGRPYTEKTEKDKTQKAIYSYDLSSDEWSEEPVYLINDDDLLKQIESKYGNSEMSKYASKSYHNRIKDFSPSAIAVHPQSGDIYVLSSVGKSLVILDDEGSVKSVVMLDERQHTQPEGICFTADGTMYISNEGKGLVAKIYEYGPK